MGASGRSGLVRVVIAATVVLVVITALAAQAAVVATRAAGARQRARAVRGEGEASSSLPAGLLPDAPPRIAVALEQAGLEAPPQVVWSAWLAAIVAGPGVALVGAGVAAAALVACFGVAAPAAALWVRRHHGDLRLERDLPGALEAVARSVRSGASLRQAVAEAAMATPGPLGRELTLVARQAAHGASLVEALEALGTRRPTGGVRLAVAALCLGAETGGAQARAVDGVAATLRDRFAVAAEVKALSSQARMSAMVIGLAPLAFGAFAVTTDRRTADFLFHTPLGLVLLAVGVALDGLGWLWMQHLAREPA